MRPAWLAALALIAAASPAPARAHLVGVEFGDFYAGALHVVTAVEHLAAITALAILAVIQPRESGRWVLVAAPVGLLVGALLATLGGADRAMDVVTLGAFALVGALAAWSVRLDPATTAGLAAGTGLAHGFANGVAAAGAAIDPWLYSAGVAAAGLACLTLASGAAGWLSDRAPRVAVVWRVMGSWIAAAGFAALGLAAVQAATNP